MIYSLYSIRHKTTSAALYIIITVHRGGWQRVTCHLVLGKGYLITYQIAFNVNRLNLFHKCASNNFWLFPLPKGRKINFNLKSSSRSICMSQCSILYIIWGNKWQCDRRGGEGGKKRNWSCCLHCLVRHFLLSGARVMLYCIVNIPNELLL